MSTTERQIRRIRYKLFGNMVKQEIGWFDSLNGGRLTEIAIFVSFHGPKLKISLVLGELLSRLFGDLDKLREGMGFHVADFICLLSRVIGTLAYSFYAGWKLTIVFLSISPFIIISFNILIRVNMTIFQT